MSTCYEQFQRFTIHADDAFVGLKSLTEHYFNPKRKEKFSFNPDCLFNLHLIVCNDAKARNIGYLTQERMVHARNTLKREREN